MAAITRAVAVQRVRRMLGDFPWETTGSAASSSSVVVVADGTDWAEGDVGEFEDDGEQFWVKSISTNDLTCVRGYNGTTAATQAASSRILKNPRYGLIEIQNAIESVIQTLPYPRIYKVVADTVTPDPATTVWYDVAAPALDLVSVTQLYGTSDAKVGIYNQRRSYYQARLQRNLPTGLVASGVGIQFSQFFHPTNTVRVNYAARITDAGTTSYDDLEDASLVTEAVLYGAVAYLEASLENRKPRRPRHDRETLRGASLFDRKFKETLNLAEQELRETSPLTHR